MNNFCTLFDKNYLVFGLALHSSLLNSAGPFRLFMLAMDKTCEQVLRALALEHVVVVPLEDVITQQYAFVPRQMSFGQMCWTCQPLLCSHVLDRYGVEAVTYLEADSYFFADPQLLFAEVGGRSVSLVPHNYVPAHDQTATSGIYCVQFNLFRNDEVGRRFLQEWESACLKYHRDRARYFPGQLCMDDWADRSASVHVVRHPGAGVAPWNESRFRVGLRDGRPTVDELPVVFYHFHELSFISDGTFFLSSYALQRDTIERIYRPYLEELKRLRKQLRTSIPSFDYCKSFRSPGLWASLSSLESSRIRAYLKYLYCYYRGRRNIVRLDAPARTSVCTSSTAQPSTRSTES